MDIKLAAPSSTSMQILVAMAAIIHKSHQIPGLQATLKDFDLHGLLLADNMVKYTSQSAAESLPSHWLEAMLSMLQDLAPFTGTPLLQDLLQLYGSGAFPKSAWACLILKVLSATPRTLQSWLESAVAPEVGNATSVPELLLWYIIPVLCQTQAAIHLEARAWLRPRVLTLQLSASSNVLAVEFADMLPD